eukprot:Sdes_comp18697_c0_seq1m8991
MFVLDKSGYFTDCGAFCSQILGYTREEILGKHISFIFPELTSPFPSCLGPNDSTDNLSLKNPCRWGFGDFSSLGSILKTRTNDGKLLETGLTEVVDVKESGYVVFFRKCSDIMDARRISPFLKEVSCVLLVSPCGKIEFAPDFGSLFLGLTSSQLAGRPIMEFVCNEDMLYFVRKMSELFQNGMVSMKVRMCPPSRQTAAASAEAAASSILEIELWGKLDPVSKTALILINQDSSSASEPRLVPHHSVRLDMESAAEKGSSEEAPVGVESSFKTFLYDLTTNSTFFHRVVEFLYALKRLCENISSTALQTAASVSHRTLQLASLYSNYVWDHEEVKSNGR